MTKQTKTPRPDSAPGFNDHEDRIVPHIHRARTIREGIERTRQELAQEDLSQIDYALSLTQQDPAYQAFIADEEAKLAWHSRAHDQREHEETLAHLSVEGEEEYMAGQGAEIAWREHHVPLDNTLAEIDGYDEQLAAERAASMLTEKAPTPAALGGGGRQREFTRDKTRKEWRSAKQLKAEIVRRLEDQLAFDTKIASGALVLDESAFDEAQKEDRLARRDARSVMIAGPRSRLTEARFEIHGPRPGKEGRFCRVMLLGRNGDGEAVEKTLISVNSLEGLAQHLNDTFFDPEFAIGEHKAKPPATLPAGYEREPDRPQSWVNRSTPGNHVHAKDATRPRRATPGRTPEPREVDLAGIGELVHGLQPVTGGGRRGR